jgi:hypothetical protein
MHGLGVAFEQQRFDAIGPEQVGQRQPGRTGADDCDGKMRWNVSPSDVKRND